MMTGELQHMTFEDIIQLIQSIFLGKTKPDLGANPFVIAAWVCVPGLFTLAKVYATRGKDLVATVFGGLAAAIVALMLFNAVPPAAAPIPGPTNGPVVNAPTKPTPPPPVVAGAGSLPSGGSRPATPPQLPQARFDRSDNTVLTGRPWAPSRAMQMSECVDLCSKDDGCVALVYDNGKCEMKGELGRVEKFDGPFSMIKRK
jgi:hypothetical protein